MRRTWIKLYVDQVLRGSMIAELSPTQRWMFVGLILLAGDSPIPGLVYRRKDENGQPVGYSDLVLADTLGVDVADVAPGLARMVEKSKVAIDPRGVISICNWTKYQSEYERTKHAPSRSVQKYGLERDVDVDRDVEREEERVVDRKPADLALSVVKDIIQKWNRFADGHGLSAINDIPSGSARERALRARVHEKGFDFEAILRAIHEQPFLYGDNDRGWLVTFDWILGPKNLQKIMERAYVKNRIGDAARRAPEDPRVGGTRRLP